MKAPVPDGFKTLFFKKNGILWTDNVYDTIIQILEGNEMPEKLNDTHIVFIPKVENPKFTSQFRSVSLCNVAYKIVKTAIVN